MILAEKRKYGKREITKFPLFFLPLMLVRMDKRYIGRTTYVMLKFSWAKLG